MSERRVSGYMVDGVLTYVSEDATLRKVLPNSEGKSVPPWGQRNFSFAFTGQPPVEAYKDLLDRM